MRTAAAPGFGGLGRRDMRVSVKPAGTKPDISISLKKRAREEHRAVRSSDVRGAEGRRDQQGTAQGISPLGKDLFGLRVGPKVGFGATLFAHLLSCSSYS